MPEVVSCPKCRRKSRVPDELIGKKVKCPGCGETFSAVANAPSEKPAPAAEVDEAGVTDEPKKESKKGRDRDNEEDEDRPRSARSRRQDDDEDDEDRPRRQRRSSRREEDDDDDDEPRRGARQGQGEGTDTFGILSVVIGGVALVLIPLGCGCCGFTWYAAAPLAIIGGALGIWGRGALRIIGLSLNIIAFLPGAALSVMLVTGAAFPNAMGGGNNGQPFPGRNR